MNDHQESVKTFIILLVLSFLLIILDTLKIFNPVKNFVSWFVIPSERTLYQGKINFLNKFSFISMGENNQQKIEMLEKQNRELSGIISKLQTCQQENKDMRRLLGSPLPSNWQFLPVQIVGTENGSLIIDKGSQDSVKEGMMAVFENTFIGKVSTVGQNFSKVDTPKSERVKIPVNVKPINQDGFTGKGIVSYWGGKIRLDRVLLEEKINEGDLIFTSGEANYLPGLTVGKIKKIQKKESDIFQQAEVDLVAEYEKLNTLFLVIVK